jgi:hypothetical protein
MRYRYGSDGGILTVSALQLWKWLEQVFETEDLDISQDPNRDLRTRQQTVKVLKVVIPCVRLDPDTGRIIDWGTWTADQNFQGNVDIDGNLNVDGTGIIDLLLTLGNNIQMGDDQQIILDTAGDIYLYSDGVNVLFYVDGALFMTLEPGLLSLAAGVDFGAVNIIATGDITSGDDVIVGDDILLDIGGLLVFDADGDANQTYMRADADNRIQVVVGGSVHCVYHSDRTEYSRIVRCAQEIDCIALSGGDPTNRANIAQFYAKDVSASAEAFCQDEGGTATQLSAHDKEGYHMHRSTIPKRGIELEIDIEKFFRDKFPEYVREVKLSKHKQNERVSRQRLRNYKSWD